jgi:type II secretory pathway component PulF
MPLFSYTALNTSGQQVAGKLTVGSRGEVFRKLESQSLTPVKVVEESAAAANKAAAAEANRSGPVRLKRPQIIHFTDEIADLLDGGLQIDQALRLMEERQDSPEVKQVASILRQEVREGATISKALRKASPSFDDLYVNMVAAGEATGSLSEILRRLASSMTVLQELQNKVTAAMVYPALLIMACIALLVVFMTVLVPQLTSLLSASGGKLPLATEILIQFTNFISQWWWLIATVVITAVILFKSYISTKAGRLWWHETMLSLPLFGAVISTRLYAQISQSMGNLVSNGVPLLNGLRLTTKTISNIFLQGLMTQAYALVSEGASLSSALRKVGGFPSLLTDMIAVGEQTGALGKSLEKSALRYDKELDKRIKRLTTLISPAIMIFMAVIVGLVAYSIVTAIFQTSQGIRRSA